VPETPQEHRSPDRFESEDCAKIGKGLTKIFKTEKQMIAEKII